MAYNNIEPFGEKRADYRAALIARTIAEVNRNPKKKTTPYKLDDFLLKFGGTQQPVIKVQTIEEQKAQLLAIHAAFSGNGRRKKK